MLRLKGQPLNVKKPILGKVTRVDQGILSRKRYIFLTEDLGTHRWLYAGVLSNSGIEDSSGSKRGPCVCSVNICDLQGLGEGDIVALEPNGTISVLWKATSAHNSIFATGSCNCACIMCPQPASVDPQWLAEFNLRLINLVEPSEAISIGITGGEPTLQRDNLVKIISACKRKLPSTALLLLTNGRRLKDLDIVKQIVEIGHPNLTFCIPLYADNDTEHDRIVGVKGSFYDTLHGIKNLALFRQKVEIRNVLLSLNYARLPQFGEFIYHNFPFVVHIALMGIEVTGMALTNVHKLWIDPVLYVNELRSIVRYLHQREMNVSIYNLQLCILPKELWRFSRMSISDWKNVFLEACQDCGVREHCCGFFSTSGGWRSKEIHVLKETGFAKEWQPIMSEKGASVACQSYVLT